MNLGAIIQHVSGHCCKDFQGHGVKGQGHRATATEICVFDCSLTGEGV